MAFSGVVQLTGLNDFVSPSQACIKPWLDAKKDGESVPRQGGNTGRNGKEATEHGSEEVVLRPPSRSAGGKRAKPEAGSGAIVVDSGGGYHEVTAQGSLTPLPAAKVSLSDCLACSGCVTSAESILINAQSVAEFRAALANANGKVFAASVSAQTRASLAARWGLSVTSVHRKLVTFFRSIGVDHVFDAGFGRHIALLESGEEFVRRYRAAEAGESSTALPVLSSSCPGWICFAEKANNASTLVPLLSAVKSPQQVMGSLVKGQLAVALGKTARDLYHVTIMPCYDKKLEASRDDFQDPTTGARDVDCVLATSELEEMLEAVDFAGMAESPLPEMFTLAQRAAGSEAVLLGHDGVSGGFADFVFKYAALKLFGVRIERVDWAVVRNKDCRVASLEVGGVRKLHFAIMNGFRNIQGLMAKFGGSTTLAAQRKGASTSAPASRSTGARDDMFDFVEVMACPSGCVNGGGQIRPPPGSGLAAAREILTATEREFHNHARQSFDQWIAALPAGVDAVYSDFVGAGPGSPAAVQRFHTQYHVRAPEPTAADAKAGASTEGSTAAAFAIRW